MSPPTWFFAGIIKGRVFESIGREPFFYFEISCRIKYMLKDAILNFPQQFAFEPVIKNAQNLKKTDKFILIGMGGSHLSAGIVKVWKPELDLRIHRNYGLPELKEEVLRESLVILSSYSGNTEEVIDAFLKAKEKGLSTAVITIGGKLLELAQENQTSYVQMPDTGIEPRFALGYSLKALLKILGDEEALKEVSTLAESLKPTDYENQGRVLAEKLKGYVPIIYSSAHNLELAYNWKIKFNETGKIPAFYNRLPELNHNEMTGFDVKESTMGLSAKFHFIFLKDQNDDLRIQKRMAILEKLYKDRGLPVEIIELKGQNVFHKIFSSLVLADWASFYTAEIYGVEAEAVPMVEEFKKLIS